MLEARQAELQVHLASLLVIAQAQMHSYESWYQGDTARSTPLAPTHPRSNPSTPPFSLSLSVFFSSFPPPSPSLELQAALQHAESELGSTAALVARLGEQLEAATAAEVRVGLGLKGFRHGPYGAHRSDARGAGWAQAGEAAGGGHCSRGTHGRCGLGI